MNKGVEAPGGKSQGNIPGRRDKDKDAEFFIIGDGNGRGLGDSERVGGEGDIKAEPVQRQIYNISSRKQTEQNRTEHVHKNFSKGSESIFNKTSCSMNI